MRDVSGVLDTQATKGKTNWKYERLSYFSLILRQERSCHLVSLRKCIHFSSLVYSVYPYFLLMNFLRIYSSRITCVIVLVSSSTFYYTCCSKVLHLLDRYVFMIDRMYYLVTENQDCILHPNESPKVYCCHYSWWLIFVFLAFWSFLLRFCSFSVFAVFWLSSQVLLEK